MSRIFLQEGELLQHGSQLVSRLFGLADDDDREMPKGEAAERRFYTLEFVNSVLKEIANPPDAFPRLRDGLARMLAFDAIVGSNDRHAQNWGVVVDASGGAMRFSPIFDTARGLFWNIPDEVLEETDLAGKRISFVKDYAERSQPLITVTGRKNDNHFDVIGHVVEGGGPCAQAARHVISSFRPADVEGMLHRDFRHILSRRRLEYLNQLLHFRHGKLRTVCRL
jgi:hypothetical protein